VIACCGNVKGSGGVVLSFVFGLLGKRWWWPAIFALSGLAFELLVINPKVLNWRREAGLTETGESALAGIADMALSLALALLMSYLAYWLGLVLKYYSTDWLRLYRDSRSRNTRKD